MCIRRLLTIFSALAFVAESEDLRQCPEHCDCGYIKSVLLRNETRALDAVFVTNCSNRFLREIPQELPKQTQYLDLSMNLLPPDPDWSGLDLLDSLEWINVESNPEVRLLPSSKAYEIWADSGYACCIVEISWQQNGLSEGHCEASDPYKECSNKLIRVPTIAIYIIIVIFFFIVDPWLSLITLTLPVRREEPYFLNTCYFCVANLLIVVYTLAILSAGCTFFNDYHYHMEEWTNSIMCGVAGWCLITGTTANSFLYMLQVICMFCKLHFPMDPSRHMTPRYLHIGAASSFGAAAFLALLPLMSKRSYHEVGLCVPFYVADNQTGYRYVLLYTVFIGSSTLVISILLGVLVRSFNKLSQHALHATVLKSYRRLHHNLILVLTAFLILRLISLSMLALSCTGGEAGARGRQWFVRLVVMETMSWPILGPLRHKKLYEDTMKAMQRAHCDWCVRDRDTGVARWQSLKDRVTSSFSTQTSSFRSDATAVQRGHENKDNTRNSQKQTKLDNTRNISQKQTQLETAENLL